MSVEISIYPADVIEELNTILIIASNDDREKPMYKKINIKYLNIELDKWNTIHLDCIIPEAISKDDILRVYIWQRDKNKYYIDNYQISVEVLR